MAHRGCGAHRRVNQIQNPTELARRINRLFDVMHKRAEPPLSTGDAVESITARGGLPLTVAALDALRAGGDTEATAEQLSALAEFFGVPPQYLVDTDAASNIDTQLTILRTIRDAGGPATTG